MFTNKFPFFKKGNILKKEMLECLRDYPRNFLDLYFKDYSEGIISGVDISAGEKLVIGRGIIKFDGRIYILDEEVKLDYGKSKEEVKIKVKFSPPEESRDFKDCRSEVFLDKSGELEDNELELGNFKLRKGANLRSSYDEFADFDIEYNTVNIINLKYAYFNNYTLHPKIIKAFARTIWEEPNRSYLDMTFAVSCLNSRVVDRSLIVCYLKERLDIPDEDYSNRQLYDYLDKISKGFSQPSGDKRRSGKHPNKIIVN